MVIDDEEHDREIYGRTLCYNGFDVVFASDGESARRLISEHRVDLILLDLGLPDVTGLTLLKQLRQSGRLGRTPVIALSAFSRRQMGEQARKAGCAEYIEKPTSPVEVLHVVESLIGRAPLPGVGDPPEVLDRGN